MAIHLPDTVMKMQDREIVCVCVLVLASTKIHIILAKSGYFWDVQWLRLVFKVRVSVSVRGRRLFGMVALGLELGTRLALFHPLILNIPPHFTYTRCQITSRVLFTHTQRLMLFVLFALIISSF